MCGKLKFCHHLPLLPPTPASFSFFISVNGIFILLVGLVRNLGFILDSFFFSLSYCTSKSRSYQRDLQNSARVWACLLPQLLPPWARLLSFRGLQCSPSRRPQTSFLPLCPLLRTPSPQHNHQKNCFKKHVRSPPCSKVLQGSLSHSKNCQTPYCDLRRCWKRPPSPFHLISSLSSCFSRHSSHCSINMRRTLCLKTLNSGCFLCLEIFSLWNLHDLPLISTWRFPWPPYIK